MRRLKSLQSARTMMFAVGLVTVLSNVAVLVFAKNLADDSDASSLQTIRITAGIMACAGAAFLVMGALIAKAPLGITSSALALYGGFLLVGGLIDPSSVTNGLLIKLIVFAGLTKGVMDATAYRSAEKLARAQKLAPQGQSAFPLSNATSTDAGSAAPDPLAWMSAGQAPERPAEPPSVEPEEQDPS